MDNSLFFAGLEYVKVIDDFLPECMSLLFIY
jgi:hypothetical protein